MATNRLISIIVVYFCVVYNSLAISIYKDDINEKERKPFVLLSSLDIRSEGSPSIDPDTQVCTRDGCYKEAKRMQSMMDQTVSPCDNFHQFACGKFFKERKVEPPKTAVGSFFDLMDSDAKLFKEILESPIERPDQNSFERKMKTLYRSCNDTDSMETQGLEDYSDTFRQDWPTVNSNWTTSSYDLQSLTENYLEIYTQILFEFSLKIMYDGPVGRYRLQIGQPAFLFNQEASDQKKATESYLKYYVDLATALGADRTTAEMDGRHVVNLTRDFSQYFLPAGQETNPEISNNPTTLADMNINYPYLDWVMAAVSLYDKMNIAINPYTKINVVYPGYFHGLKTVLDKTDHRTVQNLFGFSQAQKVLWDSNKQMRDIWFSFRPDTKKSREDYCIQLIDNLYNVGMVKILSKTRYSQKAKDFMDKMIANLKDSYKESITNLQWMGEKTKQKALLKLKKMSSKIGIRSDKFTDKDIDEYYQKFEVHQNTFIADFLQNSQQGEMNYLKDVNKLIQNWRWDVSMTVVNAYYEPNLNEIIFPLGIMQPPFFDQDAPSYVNYGAIGYFIGHEIGHGFDNTGRLHDERGGTTDWWTSDDERKYKQRAQCFIDQYSGFKVEQVNMKINGSLSATENIADNLGVTQAFQAYRKYVSTNPGELPLPDLHLTNDQTFFLATAQAWCLKRSDDSLKYRLANSRYSAEEYRNIGMMQNSPDFSKAFNCKAGDYMNPVNKCNIW